VDELWHPVSSILSEEEKKEADDEMEKLQIV
jgi:hypothetical protein